MKQYTLIDANENLVVDRGTEEQVIEHLNTAYHYDAADTETPDVTELTEDIIEGIVGDGYTLAIYYSSN